MRILVTGSDGFIGSYVCQELVDQGHTVCGLGLGLTVRNLQDLLPSRCFHFLAVNLTRGDPPPGEYDAIVHLAARAGTALSWSEFDDYLASNVSVTQRLLDWASRHNVAHFVHVSSSSVYGEFVGGQYDELQPRRPVSPYGVTKLAAEALVGAYSRAHALTTTVVRPFSVYGPRQRPDMFVNILIRHALADETVTVEGDGEQERSVTYVEDVARALCLVVESDRGRVDGQVYNVGGNEVVTVNRLVELVGRRLGVEVKTEHVAGRLGDQRVTVANTQALRRDTGWRPEVCLWDGLGRQVEWQRYQHNRQEGSLCSWK